MQIHIDIKSYAINQQNAIIINQSLIARNSIICAKLVSWKLRNEAGSIWGSESISKMRQLLNMLLFWALARL